MEARKKYTIIVVSLVIALILSLTAMIIVLVVANQNATSAVNVKYTASEVYVELSANAYFANTTTAFTSNGSPTIELSPDNTTGSLSQPNSTTSIDLNKTYQTIVFEYIFKNMTDDVNCKIELVETPAVQEHINLTYYYSNTKMDKPLNLTGETDRKAQLLNAYEGETTYKYIYIIASIDNLLYDASLEGDFTWGLSKPKDSDLTIYTLNVNADYVERDSTSYSSAGAVSTMEVATLSGQSLSVEDIDVYPAKANKTFVGWSYTDGGSAISSTYLGDNDAITNKVSLLSSTTLYPVYKEGSIPASYYSYSNGSYTIASTKITNAPADFCIPDVYNNGTNGVAKVTKIADGNSLVSGQSITNITFGRYIKCIGSHAFANMSYNYGDNTLSIVLPEGLEEIGVSTFSMSHNIETVFLPSTLKIIGQSAFENCYSMTSIQLNEGLEDIGKYAFYDCYGLSSTFYIPSTVKSIDGNPFGGLYTPSDIVVAEGNQYYDSRGHCLIETATNKLLTISFATTEIPNFIERIGCYSLNNNSWETITIPASVYFIEQNFCGDNAFSCTRIVFEAPYNWARSTDEHFTLDVTYDISLTDPEQNWNNYYSLYKWGYYWQKFLI